MAAISLIAGNNPQLQVNAFSEILCELAQAYGLGISVTNLEASALLSTFAPEDLQIEVKEQFGQSVVSVTGYGQLMVALLESSDGSKALVPVDYPFVGRMLNFLLELQGDKSAQAVATQRKQVLFDFSKSAVPAWQAMLVKEGYGFLQFQEKKTFEQLLPYSRTGSFYCLTSPRPQCVRGLGSFAGQQSLEQVLLFEQGLYVVADATQLLWLTRKAVGLKDREAFEDCLHDALVAPERYQVTKATLHQPSAGASFCTMQVQQYEPRQLMPAVLEVSCTRAGAVQAFKAAQGAPQEGVFEANAQLLTELGVFNIRRR